MSTRYWLYCSQCKEKEFTESTNSERLKRLWRARGRISDLLERFTVLSALRIHLDGTLIDEYDCTCNL